MARVIGGTKVSVLIDEVEISTRISEEADSILRDCEEILGRSRESLLAETVTRYGTLTETNILRLIKFVTRHCDILEIEKMATVTKER